MDAAHNINRETVVTNLSSIPMLYSIGIGYVSNGVCEIWKESPMPEGMRSSVIINQTKSAQSTNFTHSAHQLRTAPKPKNESAVVSELISAGISCTSAVATGFAAAGSTILAPLTAGTSAAGAYLFAAGSLVSAGQCGVSIGRLINYYTNPHANQILDDSIWFSRTMYFMDAVGTVASVGQLYKGVSFLKRLHGLTGKKGIAGIQALRKLPRAQRKQLARDLQKLMHNNKKEIKRLIKEGKLPKVIYRQEINRELTNQILQGVSSGITLGSSNTIGDVGAYIVNEADKD